MEIKTAWLPSLGRVVSTSSTMRPPRARCLSAMCPLRARPACRGLEFKKTMAQLQSRRLPVRAPGPPLPCIVSPQTHSTPGTRCRSRETPVRAVAFRSTCPRASRPSSPLHEACVHTAVAGRCAIGTLPARTARASRGGKCQRLRHSQAHTDPGVREARASMKPCAWPCRARADSVRRSQ